MFTHPKKTPPPPSNKSVVMHTNKQPVKTKQNLLSELISNAMTGFSFGIGSAIARDAVSGLSTADTSKEPFIKEECKSAKDIYEICMSNKDISDCDYLQKEYQNCLNK